MSTQAAANAAKDWHDMLSAPFPPELVSWRVGSTNGDKTRGMALAYIDARDVMKRLDDAVGCENWQTDYPWGDAKRVICRIGIKFGSEWVWKADGAGDTDYEGEKGALSDAFKRAAVKWGIGRYLYDVAAPWVAIEPMGKSFKIAETDLSRLRGLLAGKSMPPPPRLTQTPKAAPAAPVGAKRARFVKIQSDIRAIQNTDALDAYMDGVKEEIGEFPPEGRVALDLLYKQQHELLADEIPY